MRRPKAGAEFGWFFEPIGQMGGASSGAYQNSLAGVGVMPAQLFAREAIQNSVDAAQPGLPSVAVRFSSKSIDGAQLIDLRRALQLNQGDEPLEREGLLPGQNSSIDSLLAKPLRVLFIEDSHTVGLGGTTDPIDPTEEDNYFRLCLMLGDTRETEGGGGTFGYGKAVYWAMSKLATVVFYSRFRPTERTKGVSARLIAISWFKKHTHPATSDGRSIRYTGRAFFGVPGQDGCQPLTDEAADERAERLGFRKRGPGECGVSIMILGSGVEMGELRQGVERHWWPRILDGKLDVSFALDAEDTDPPRPRLNRDLLYYVRAWDLLNGKVEPGPRDLIKDVDYRRTVLGQFAITTGAEEEDEEFGDVQGPARDVDIALVRRPGMVVEYLAGPALSPTQPTCGAVFMADSGMNAVFAASEPPAHNKWDRGTTRKDRPLSDEQRRQIENALDKIKKAARAFVQSKQAPPPIPPPRCRELEKLLGKWIGLGPEPPPPPARGADPFVVHFVEDVSRIESHEGVALDAKVAVALRENETLEPENIVRVRAWVDTIVDDGVAAPKEERLSMAYMVAKEKGGAETTRESDPLGSYVDVVLSPGGPSQTVDLRSEILPHAEYRASLRLSVEVLP